MINVGVFGGSGYTAAELFRLIAFHPEVNLQVAVSGSNPGVFISDLFPSLRKVKKLKDKSFQKYSDDVFNDCEIVFFTTPHGVCMNYARKILTKEIKIIDLSPDFRLKEIDLWNKWYKSKHSDPELLKMTVYGLTERNRELIKNANLVANPGCYATAVQIALLPLIEKKLLINQTILANVKSGVTGAGRSESIEKIYPEINENFKAYNATGHRHHPEIYQELYSEQNGNFNLKFLTHLLPINRGIFASIFFSLANSFDLQKIYRERYSNDYFIDVMPKGSHPEIRYVTGSNFCRLAIHNLGNNEHLILCTLDNLVKGAAGQAMQNLNIMCRLNENLGLDMPAFYP